MGYYRTRIATDCRRLPPDYLWIATDWLYYFLIVSGLPLDCLYFTFRLLRLTCLNHFWI